MSTENLWSLGRLSKAQKPPRIPRKVSDDCPRSLLPFEGPMKVPTTILAQNAKITTLGAILRKKIRWTGALKLFGIELLVLALVSGSESATILPVPDMIIYFSLFLDLGSKQVIFVR